MEESSVRYLDNSIRLSELAYFSRVCGGVKRLALAVCLSGICLSTQKSGYLTIYRVKRLLNTAVTLKSKKNCPGVYLIVSKTVPIAASLALSNLTTVHPAIFNTVTTRIRRGARIYELWTRVHIGV